MNNYPEMENYCILSFFIDVELLTYHCEPKCEFFSRNVFLWQLHAATSWILFHTVPAIAINDSCLYQLMFSNFCALKVMKSPSLEVPIWEIFDF